MRLTPKQAAEHSRASLSLIYRWIQEGLPHYRYGSRGKRGRIYIDDADLNAFIESRKVIVGTDGVDDGPLKFIR
jgi:predicted site-specific integrase-resolvase